MSCVLFYYFVIRLLNIIFSNRMSLAANTQVFFSGDQTIETRTLQCM